MFVGAGPLGIWCFDTLKDMEGCLWTLISKFIKGRRFKFRTKRLKLKMEEIDNIPRC
jgi:hypothetical protein